MLGWVWSQVFGRPLCRRLTVPKLMYTGSKRGLGSAYYALWHCVRPCTALHHWSRQTAAVHTAKAASASASAAGALRRMDARYMRCFSMPGIAVRVAIKIAAFGWHKPQGLQKDLGDHDADTANGW